MVLALSLACCGGLGYFSTLPRNGIRVEVLKAEIERQLPRGSSRQQAEEWFTAHGFEPWAISEIGGRQVGIGATIRNDSWLESAEITVEVYFDTEGRVREVVVDRFVFCL
jgi:hypothetical protein